MDLIYTNARKEDQGVVPNFKLDLSFGYDENNFELSVSNTDHICEDGSVIYMEGTEYGGIIDAIRVETENRKIIYLGNTWHGLLESKVIEPDGKHTENTASGENLHLTDSADSKAVSFGLYGKAEQEQYSGKNLLKYPYHETNHTDNTVVWTDNGDGSVKASGTASPNTSMFLYSFRTEHIKAGKYILSGCPVGGSRNTYYQWFGLWDGTTNVYGQYDIGNGANITVTEEQAETCTFVVACYIYTGYTANNLVFKPMLRLASITDDTYEPYVGGIASPNPDYPQEITVSGSDGSVEVVSCGKNRVNVDVEQGYPSNTNSSNTTPRFFDDDTYVVGMAYSNYYAPDRVSDYVKTDNGFSVSMKTGYGVGFPLKNIKPLTDYTLSFDVVPAMTGQMTGIAYYDKNGNFIQGSRVTSDSTTQGTHFEKTFTIPEGAERSVIVIANAFEEMTTHTVSNLQFESGTSVTEYEPYKETTSTIPTPDGLCGIKVSSGGNYTDDNGQQWITDEIVKYADGSGKRIQRIAKRVFDGVNNACGWVGTITGATETLTQMNLNNTDALSLGVYSIICDRFSVDKSWWTDTNTLAYTCRQSTSNGTCCCYLKESDGITDKATANAWLQENPVTVYYILKEPIITDLSAEEIAEIEKLYTFYPVTNISNDADCGMSITYMAVDEEVCEGMTYTEGAYLTLSGDANSVLNYLIKRMGLPDLFKASSELSGLTINNYSMHRYVKGYTGIKKMLATVNGKLKFTFAEGYVILSAEPLVDYSKDDEFDSDQIDFVIEKKFKPTNHMICLGKGELKDRTVIHLYTDAEGNISKAQSLFGLDERTDIYDNANVESEEELEQGGIEALQASWNEDKLQLDLDANSAYDIGDIVGARELVTGITTAKPIIQKIVTIEKDVIKITHKVGE